MNVLGVHIGHDSAAAVVVDGKLVADVAEERFSRVKHDASPPIEAIASCLEIAGLEMGQIDVLAVASVADAPALNDIFDLVGGPHEQRPGMKRAAERAAQLSRQRIRPLPERPVHARRYPLADHTELVKVAHHRAHAAAAHYTSGHQGKQLVVTMDGIGDGVSTALWRGEQGTLELIEQFDESASLGWFYGMVTEALGWRHGDGEGRTMGLAAYGDPDRAQDTLERFHPRFENGELVAAHDFGPVYTWLERGAAEWHLREAGEVAEIIGRCGREHVAAEAQRVLEAQVAEIVFPFLRREGTRALSCSGGVFLNVKLNQRIRATGLVEHFHVYPNPGDAGLAVGAALDAFHAAEPGAPVGGLADVYLGPEYSDSETDGLLAARRLDAARCEDVAGFAADQLARGRIVGWFQGRMESGPRALGNRSILMSAARAENKDVLNARVKFREPFRPFCPSMSVERAGDYLCDPTLERFMITSFDVQEAKRDAIPAAVHVDGTVRPQTVEREINPRYAELIDAFAAATGEAAIINTSFNVQGEPIVCSPRDAVRAFYDTGLDCLIIGDHVLVKDG